MMQKRFLIIPFVFALLASAMFIAVSCDKDKNQISIQGVVADPNSNIKVEGATVVLSANKLEGGVYSAGYEEISRTMTDPEGAFSFNYEEEIYGGYRMYISKNGYFSNSVDISANDIQAGETYSPVFELYPIGYIKLNVININPYDSLDEIAYYFSSGYRNCYECCDNNTRYGYGMYVNDSLKCMTAGNTNVALTWRVKKNNHLVIHDGIVFCKAFDTVSFQINY